MYVQVINHVKLVNVLVTINLKVSVAINALIFQMIIIIVEAVEKPVLQNRFVLTHPVLANQLVLRQHLPTDMNLEHISRIVQAITM